MTAERPESELVGRIVVGFSPPAEALDRIERQVAAAFRDAVDEGRIAGRDVQLGSTPRLAVTGAWRRRTRRHAAALGLAASLVLAGSVAVASAETVPGRPLFMVRLAVERALMPSHPGSERIAAQVAVLDRRLVEAADADAGPDAIADAMRAYRTTLHELEPEIGEAPDQASTIERAVQAQIARIEALESRNTATVQGAFDGAARDARALLLSLESPPASSLLPRSSARRPHPAARTGLRESRASGH